MTKTTEQKIESAKVKLDSNRIERNKLSKKTFVYFIGEYRKKYPLRGSDQRGRDMLSYDYADMHQLQNSERLDCLLKDSLVLRRNLKKWRDQIEKRN